MNFDEYSILMCLCLVIIAVQCVAEAWGGAL